MTLSLIVAACRHVTSYVILVRRADAVCLTCHWTTALLAMHTDGQDTIVK